MQAQCATVSDAPGRGLVEKELRGSCPEIRKGDSLCHWALGNA